MLVGITGISSSGRKTAVEYLSHQGFTVLSNDPETLESIVERWQEDFVVLIRTVPDEIRKRPWFVHLNLEASDLVRARRESLEGSSISDDKPDTINESNPSTDLTHRLSNIRHAHVNLINDFDCLQKFYEAIDDLKLRDLERVRPSWDRYFMTLADLASQRSNCMKRRVGCVLVNDNRIVSTGYNGTPRGSRNCNEGGCERCNSGSKGGTSLGTCLCLHAEENALLEAGRPRVTGSILYCNTCPCLTCSIKIVQTGVSEVVYSQDYSMDQISARVLKDGGVKLRKYTGFI